MNMGWWRYVGAVEAGCEGGGDLILEDYRRNGGWVVRVLGEAVIDIIIGGAIEVVAAVGVVGR
jgi:hypothetical protein